jgi:hypothetical protein
VVFGAVHHGRAAERVSHEIDVKITDMQFESLDLVHEIVKNLMMVKKIQEFPL